MYPYLVLVQFDSGMNHATCVFQAKDDQAAMQWAKEWVKKLHRITNFVVARQIN
jgi:hypothetical protein